MSKCELIIDDLKIKKRQDEILSILENLWPHLIYVENPFGYKYRVGLSDNNALTIYETYVSKGTEIVKHETDLDINIDNYSFINELVENFYGHEYNQYYNLTNRLIESCGIKITYRGL